MNAQVAVVLIAFSWVVQSALAQQGRAAFDDRPKITVSGEAVVNVVPDKILVSFGIETVDNQIETAKQKNSAILRKATEALNELHIPTRDVQTDYISIEPRYEDSYKHRGFLGYFVRNMFVVTLNDVSKVDELITRMLAVGVNHLNSVDFQTTEFKRHREHARELALEAAREKATKMAGTLGEKLGPTVQINEGHGGWWYYSSWTSWGASSRRGGMSQVTVQNVPSGGDPNVGETIALGKIGIRANVSVTFELLR